MAKKKKKAVGLTNKQKKVAESFANGNFEETEKGEINMPYHTGKGSHSRGMKKSKMSKMSKPKKKKKKKK